MRIASLLPSSTEICFALGLGPSVVGVTHECDFPPQAQYKPILTRSTLDHAGQPQAAIDRHVRQHHHQGSSLYALDLEALARARPDLVLTQELCEVCAVAYPQVLEAVRVLPGHPSVVSLEPDSLPGIWRSIAEVGRVTGTAARARELIASFSARIDAVRGAVAGRPRVRVVCVEWYDPL
ncbi:MAG TPA: ABC transporter substrate-binding protein, partial [Candidatus Dormibacteraeota bacterium]|nr:ABC transporter substrate-binding protein [Candidatus Dormibacteraeota bacterium]